MSSGEKINLTDAVEDLGWQENEGELAMKLTFNLYNAKHNGKAVSSLLGIGCLVAVKANWGSGSGTVAYCKIQEAERVNTGKDYSYKVTAYDCLYDMQKSQDNVYYASGKRTKTVLTAICKNWSLTVNKYTGANVKHSTLVYKNKRLSDIILDILDLAKKKGGGESILRASEGKIQILKIGSNADVYVFTTDNTVTHKFKRSTADMVTRVKIYSTSSGSDKTKIEATVNGKTKYGIRQKLVSKSKSETLKDAKKEAKEILEEDGSPEDTRTFEAPDIPPIRKGDKICWRSGSSDTYFVIKSIQHDADKGKMTMKVKPYKESSSGSSSSSSKSGSNGTKMKVTANSGLNLRQKPNGKILLTMKKGTTCTWNGKIDGNWYHVTYNSTTGYAYKSWLKKA